MDKASNFEARKALFNVYTHVSKGTMSTYPFSRVFTFFVFLCFAITLNGQSYIKSLNAPEQSLRQKIIRFSNGDLLIGDSSFELANQEGTGKILLTRMDECGLVVWSNAYERTGNDLHFRDFDINNEDHVFVFGRYVEDIFENIFLMEVDPDGGEMGFRAYRTDTPGTSSFTIDEQDDKLLISGRTLEIGVATTGYVAVFTTNLNLVWAKKMRPHAFEGASIITREGDIVHRSISFNYKFNGNGDLLWSNRMDFSIGPQPVGGPFEVNGGYLYHAFFEGISFLYKLNPSGQMLWQSDLFPSTKFPVALQESLIGDLIIHYSAPETNGNGIRQLILSSSGQKLEHYRLDSEFSINVGSVFHSFGNNDLVDLVANNDPMPSGIADLNDAFIQFSLEEGSPTCVQLVEIEETQPNNYNVTFPVNDEEILPLEMQELDFGSLQTELVQSPFSEWCGVVKDQTVIEVDTFLDCKENWTVSLPSMDFEWEDNIPESQRVLKNIGSYRARNRDCADPTVYEFRLDRAVCDCLASLPNIFTPNGDGQNDWVEFSTDCQITELQSTVYDRWGNLIYKVRNSERVWDGTHERSAATTGVYIIIVEYRLTSNSGGEQEGIMAQDILLFR